MKNPTVFLRALILIVSLFVLESASAQQFLKNEISADLDFSGAYVGTGIAYSRSITPQIAFLGKLTTGGWKADINQLKNGALKGASSSIGLGTEWAPFGKNNGFYVQGFARYTTVKVDAKGKKRVFDDYDTGFLLVDIFATLVSPSYEYYSYSDKRSDLSFSGKMGYRFMNKEENLYFSPYIAMQSNPFQEKNLTLTTSSSDEIVNINPSKMMKKGSSTFGVELGVRF